MSVLRVLLWIEVVGACLVAVGAFLWSGDRAPGVGMPLSVIGGVLMGPVALAFLIPKMWRARREPTPRPG